MLYLRSSISILDFDFSSFDILVVCDVVGLPLVVAGVPHLWLHGGLLLHILCALFHRQAGDHRLHLHTPLLRLHLHHGLPILPPHRWAKTAGRSMSGSHFYLSTSGINQTKAYRLEKPRKALNMKCIINRLWTLLLNLTWTINRCMLMIGFPAIIKDCERWLISPPL